MFIVAAFAMAIYAITDTGFAILIRNLMAYLDLEDESPAENGPGADGLGEDALSVGQYLPIAIIGLFLVRGLAAFFSAYCLGWIGRNVIMVLRGQAFDKFLVLPTKFFDSISAGEMLSRLTFNVEQVAEATSNVVTVLIRDTLTIVCLLAYMLYLSPPLTGILLVTGPLMALVISMLSKVFRRHSARIQSSVGDVARITEEALQSHRVVKMYSGQQYENARFGAVNEKNMRLNMRLIGTRAVGDALINIVIAMGVAGVIYFVMFEEFRPPVADMASFITAMVFLLRPIRQITNINVAIQRGIAAGISIFELLDQPEETDTGTLVVDRVDGRVEFRDVSFTYSTEKGAVLADISLQVASGEMLAIVGRSGSGKSTLVSLLPRFYDTAAGQILLDGRPLQEYQLANLRNQISFVSQEVVLFNDSIANNIAYGGLRSATRAEIERAAHAAHVDEFVDALPEGFETQVGDRGVMLSGGQRQRIAIARALLKNAPILILDEATSALDTESERHIQHALAELILNRTTFVIAHRLSTVERADRIIVMADGRIIESGTHVDLLALDGQYAHLHRMQFKDEVS